MAEAFLFLDRASVTKPRRTKENFLVADCRIARAGNIQVYSGAELNRPDLETVRVWRDPGAIFDKKAMQSWAYRPATLGHPPEMVQADNWRDHAVGTTGAEVLRDGEHIVVSMCLMDGNAIAAFEEGVQELSCGYLSDLEFEPGKAPSGEEYDARVTSLVGNHVALVPRGRAGSTCRFGDAALRAVGATPPLPIPAITNGGRAVPDADIRTVVVDGLTIPVTTQGAEVITRLQRQLADATGATDALRTDHARAVQALEGQVSALRDEASRSADAHRGEVDGLRASHQQALDGLNAQIAALQAQTSDAAIDARVTARAALLAQARRVLGDAYDASGQSDHQIRRAVVTHALPAVQVADSASDDYVRALFDHAVTAPPPAAPQPDTLRSGIATTLPTADAAQQQPQLTAHQRYVRHLETAHRAGREG